MPFSLAKLVDRDAGISARIQRGASEYRMEPVFLNWMKSMARRNAVPAWIKPFVRDGVRASAALMKRRYHTRMAHRAMAGRIGNLDDIEHFLTERFVPLSLPLVLISQAERSGGTMLSQLFDGHPAVAAYPHELRFGGQIGNPWPVLDISDTAANNFLRLMDYNFPRLVRRGFAKGYQSPERFRFALITKLQYAMFSRMCERKPPTSERDLFDYFYTAFFNGWLDYQGRLDSKRYITAFAPRVANDAINIERFVKQYPDGFLIQVVREPNSWFGSMSNHGSRSQAKRLRHGLGAKTSVSGDDLEAEQMIRKWTTSAESMLRNGARLGDKHLVLKFEDLVARPEATMKAVAARLGIDFDPALSEPTFNGQLMKANSSFGVDQAGLIHAPLDRGRVVPEAKRELVEEKTGGLYQKVLSKAVTI